jgi:hypothetical protein
MVFGEVYVTESRAEVDLSQMGACARCSKLSDLRSAVDGFTGKDRKKSFID